MKRLDTVLWNGLLPFNSRNKCSHILTRNWMKKYEALLIQLDKAYSIPGWPENRTSPYGNDIIMRKTQAVI